MNAGGGALMPLGKCVDVNNYERIAQIGEGTYGLVFMARDKKTNQIVALKKVRMEAEKDGFPVTALREIQVLYRLTHPNIVRLVDVAVGSKVESVFLVFEYCSHDLSGLMERVAQPFSEAEVKRIMLQLLSAVKFMHARWILHRDLKMSNVLYTDKGEIKLADFGLARPFGDSSAKLTPRVVTLWYRCPELLFGCSSYSTPMDMWAVGCIFAELLLHAPLIPGGTELKQINLMCELLGSPNSKIWPGFHDLALIKNGLRLPDQPFSNLSRRFPRLSTSGLDLLNQFLTYDPARRISADAALRHPYFDESPKAKPANEMPTFPQFNGLQLRATKRKSEAAADAAGGGAARPKQEQAAKKPMNASAIGKYF